MRQLFKIAQRNIFRNKKRTVITLVTIIIGVLVSMMAKGMIAAVETAIKTNVTQSMTGDFQIHASGYLKSQEAMPLDLNLKENGQEEKLIHSQPEKIAFARRINFGGLIYANEELSSVFKGMGVDPKAEQAVCPKASAFVAEGRFLSERNIYEVVISRTLAKGMGITLNSQVTLVSKDKSEFLNILDVKVVGLIDGNLPGFSKKFLYLNLKAAQEFLGLGNEYSELVVRSESLDQSWLVFQRLKKQFSRQGFFTEIHFWNEVAPFFKKILAFQKIVADIVPIIFFIMVGTGIVNTMVMAVFERVNEVGMMRALGMKRKKIVQLFYLESLSLVGIGGSIGLGLGSLLITILNAVGIKFYPPGSNLLVFLRPSINIAEALWVFVFVLIIGSLASIYPTFMASQLKPILALKRN